MATKPLIAITLDWEATGTFSDKPYYALRQHYFDAIEAAGGIPIALPHSKDLLPTYLKMVKGILIPGGDFAFPDAWYADSTKTSPFKPSPRLEIDIALIKHALTHHVPLLTICAGMQILACMHGGKLTSQIQSPINHHNGADRAHYCHEVAITPGTHLAKMIASPKIQTNSSHCEAIISISDQMIVNATASDGTIEGIEIPNHPFAIGLQWHPEFFIAPTMPDRLVFDQFIKHAAK